MPEQTLESKIEAVLFFKSEPVTASELQRLLGASKADIQNAVRSLQTFYKSRGIVIVSESETYSFGTSGAHATLIEKVQKEEFSRELGRAGLETLAIILYRSAPGAPVSRREIDQVRGVNSGYVLRSLMIRGLIERSDSAAGSGQTGRSYLYKPTLKLFEHLGITRREDLPEYGQAVAAVGAFVESGSLKEEQDTDA